MRLWNPITSAVKVHRTVHAAASSTLSAICASKGYIESAAQTGLGALDRRPSQRGSLCLFTSTSSSADFLRKEPSVFYFSGSRAMAPSSYSPGNLKVLFSACLSLADLLLFKVCRGVYEVFPRARWRRQYVPALLPHMIPTLRRLWQLQGQHSAHCQFFAVRPCNPQ